MKNTELENLKEELGNYLVDDAYRTYVFEKLDKIRERLEEKDEKIERLENEIFGLIQQFTVTTDLISLSVF